MHGRVIPRRLKLLKPPCAETGMQRYASCVAYIPKVLKKTANVGGTQQHGNCYHSAAMLEHDKQNNPPKHEGNSEGSGVGVKNKIKKKTAEKACKKNPGFFWLLTN